jgi:hypothetical protein
MTIGVMCDLAGDTVTIFANSTKVQISIADAYQLMAHLDYSLLELVKDQVIKERENLVREAYHE